MKIGNEEITRDMMPSMQIYKMNPDHLRQSIQDILNANISNPVMQQQMPMPVQPVQQGQMEERGTQW